MRLIQSMLLSSLLLSSILVGCSTNQESGTSRTPGSESATALAGATPPPVPPVPPVPKPIVPARASAPGQQLAPPAAVPRPLRAHRRVARATAGPGLVNSGLAGAAPVAAASLRPKEQLGVKVASGSLLAGANAPDSTANSWSAFGNWAGPTGQQFRVRPGRDTVLVSERGTRLAVPGTAFGVVAGGEVVQLELREFYSTADIVLAGLSTASGPNLLETGGLLHLQASVAGRPVALRPGARLGLRMPATQPQPQMQLYQGVAMAGHALDWQTPMALAAQDPNSQVNREWRRLRGAKLRGGRWPRFARGQVTLATEFTRLLPQAATAARLKRRRHLGTQERNRLRDLSHSNHEKIIELVAVRLLVDTLGNFRQPQLLAGDSVLGAAVVAAVRQLPRQQPASFPRLQAPHRRELVAAVGVLQVLYARSGRRLVGINWDETATHQPRWAAYFAQWERELTERERAEFARQFASATGPLSLESGLGYELIAGGLGWINCDRLLDPGPRIQFAVQTLDSATVVSLVFQGQRSILASSRTEGARAIFEQVPTGQAATIVALRRAAGITYLATQPVRLGAAPVAGLQFRPVTLAELRGELARL